MPPKPVPVPQGPVLSSTDNNKERNLAIGCEPSPKGARHRIRIISTELTKVVTRTGQEF